MDKTPISTLEANWITHLAGIQAEKLARSEGMKSGDANALLDAAAGGRIIGGITFPPISAGFMMLLSKAGEITKRRPELAAEVMESDMGHLGALALILHNPKLAWQLMSQKDGEELFARAVIEFAMEFTLDDLRSLVIWIAEEMSRLRDSGDNAGKPAAA